MSSDIQINLTGDYPTVFSTLDDRDNWPETVISQSGIFTHPRTFSEVSATPQVSHAQTTAKKRKRHQNQFPVDKLLDILGRDGRILVGCKVVCLEPAECQFYVAGKTLPGGAVVADLKNEVGVSLGKLSTHGGDNGNWQLAAKASIPAIREKLKTIELKIDKVSWEGSASESVIFEMPAEFLVRRLEMPPFYIGQVIGHVLRPS